MPNLKDCSDLLDAVRDLGVEPPASLAEVPAVFDALREAQLAYKLPGDELVAAYNAGKLTADNAAKVLSTIARTAAEAHAARDAVMATEYDLTMDFLARLNGTAGDELIEAVRPVFDGAVAGLQAAAEHLPAEVTAEQVLALDTTEAVNAWNDQPGHAAVLDTIYSTIVHPLVRTFNATAARAFDDPRQPLVAYVVDPAGTPDLYGAAHLMGAAPMSYGRGGRWRALISRGYRLHLNTPPEATALVETYIDEKTNAAEEHNAQLRAGFAKEIARRERLMGIE